MAGRGMRMLERLQGSPLWGTRPDDYDPEFAAEIRERAARLFGHDGWFHVETQGWEHLPPPPVLLVSNHSGGTTIPDLWGLMYAWTERHGQDRVVHPMGHDMIFSLEGVARAFARLGVLKARPEHASDVLTRLQRDVLVCPGGEKDTWRPYKDRYKVRFAGRKGYARISVRTGVPIVPVANAGAHETLIVLTDGAPLARLLGLPRNFRAEIFPIHLSVPWGLAVGPMPHLPVPAWLSYRFGEPIPPPTGMPEDAAVELLDEQVRASLQGLLDQLRDERPRLKVRARRSARALKKVVRRR